MSVLARTEAPRPAVDRGFETRSHYSDRLLGPLGTGPRFEPCPSTECVADERTFGLPSGGSSRIPEVACPRNARHDEPCATPPPNRGRSVAHRHRRSPTPRRTP